MAAHRYWRLVGFAVAGAGPLELSEVQLYAGGARVGATVVPSCPFAPASGTLADLIDGLATGVVSWPASVHRAPGFALVWDLTGSGADVDALRLGSGSGAGVFPTDLLLQWSDDANAWSTLAVANSIAYPGSYAMTAASTGSGDPTFGNNRILPSTPNPWTGFRQTFPLPAQWSGSVPINGAASSHLREYAFFDAYHGGLGIIYGTVKEKNTPANTPLRRKVWLMDERSGLVIRETWSDAATGAYEFRSIKQGTPYTVLAYDHAHNYRAFAGDNLLPDPMP